MAEPDFTFSIEDAPDRATIKPLYTAVLSNGPVPTVSLGAVTRAQAEDWLRAVHLTYRAGLESRSKLIWSMDLPARVELVGLADDGP